MCPFGHGALATIERLSDLFNESRRRESLTLVVADRLQTKLRRACGQRPRIRQDRAIAKLYQLVFVASFANRPIAAQAPRVTAIVTDHDVANAHVVVQLRNGEDIAPCIQATDVAVIARHQNTSTLQLQGARGTHAHELPWPRELARPLRIVVWILQAIAQGADEAQQTLSVLQLQCVNVVVEVRHASVANRRVFCDCHIRDFPICRPCLAVVIAVRDPNLVVVARIWRKNTSRMESRVFPELHGCNVANHKVMATNSHGFAVSLNLRKHPEF
mmetsp:Transcript_146326/g.364925  ORF Transcript_146326/g.364925 Transcript_146326/m.364925 type:complete len:273 (+) Transcript_146326:475-1293(+)